jgi:hypothetical protein
MDGVGAIVEQMGDVMCPAHWTNIVSEGPGRLAALAVATGLLLCYV